MLNQILNLVLGLFNLSARKPAPTAPEPEPFEVKDLRGELPVHETRVWSTRPSLAALEYVAIHHVGTPGASFEGIARYHSTPSPDNHLSTAGAPGIAYGYGIDRDGTCYQLNNDSALTWHVANRNGKALGILILADGSSETHEGSEEPTEEQLNALPQLLAYLEAKYPGIKAVGHCELATASHQKPSCPGDKIMEAINNYRS